jgi:hypothetical protein
VSVKSAKRPESYRGAAFRLLLNRRDEWAFLAVRFGTVR